MKWRSKVYFSQGQNAITRDEMQANSCGKVLVQVGIPYAVQFIFFLSAILHASAYVKLTKA